MKVVLALCWIATAAAAVAADFGHSLGYLLGSTLLTGFVVSVIALKD